MRRHGSGRLTTWLGDLRLPPDEHARQRLATEAEARRNHQYRY